MPGAQLGAAHGLLSVAEPAHAIQCSAADTSRRRSTLLLT
jgi:hypothetical protein